MSLLVKPLLLFPKIPSQTSACIFEREFSMYDRYQLDFAALKSAATRSRIVIAGGASNRDNEAYWSAVAVAEGLGSKLVEFPGRHADYVTNPAAFVRRLHEVLDAAPRS